MVLDWIVVQGIASLSGAALSKKLEAALKKPENERTFFDNQIIAWASYTEQKEKKEAEKREKRNRFFKKIAAKIGDASIAAAAYSYKDIKSMSKNIQNLTKTINKKFSDKLNEIETNNIKISKKINFVQTQNKVIPVDHKNTFNSLNDNLSKEDSKILLRIQIIIIFILSSAFFILYLYNE
jgi:hypothetical protein